MKTVLGVLFLVLFAAAKPQYEQEHEGFQRPIKGGQWPALNQTFHGMPMENLRNFTGLSSTSNQTTFFNNGTIKKDYEKGVCYEEVLTVTLVKDPNNVPPGNGSTPNHSKVRKCCPGYERNPHNFRLCDPVCEKECVNALCIAPNVCACYPDHVVDPSGKCVSTCPIGCLNGHCNQKECVCNPGYTEETNKKYCIPKCSKGCNNGKCVGPELCQCEDGYHNDKDGSCVPKCDDDCKFGKCVAPNTCVCDQGYERKAGKCSPICSKGCQHGECIAPNVCSCGHGYQMDETGTQCTAFCSHPCLNGECTGPNECTCKRGYIKDSTDPNGAKCVGHCPGGCPNGVCSGPNLCLCLPGFAKERGVKGSQNCVKRIRRELPHSLQILIPQN